MFPDPFNSPAYHTHTLSVLCSHAVTPADGEAGGWITGFSRVVRLVLDAQEAYVYDTPIPLVPFHGFSPVLKSLHMTFVVPPSSRIFDLILSFSLLEDLTLVTYYGATDNGPDEWPTVIQPSSPSIFTGSLYLFLQGGMEPIAHRLLSLPGGIHFRKLALTWLYGEDPLLITELVEGCSDTLESLSIACHLGISIRHLCPHQ
jgi:hypothetical protein